MIVPGFAESFVAPGSLGSECAESPEPEVVVYFGSGGSSSAVYLVFEYFLVLCWSCFWCSPSQSSTFLQMGQFGPHLHHSAFGDAVTLRVGCSGSWDSIFMGGLEFVAVVLELVGGIGQSFLNSKRFPYIFPALGQGVLAQSGAFSNGRGVVL